MIHPNGRMRGRLSESREWEDIIIHHSGTQRNIEETERMMAEYHRREAQRGRWNGPPMHFDLAGSEPMTEIHIGLITLEPELVHRTGLLYLPQPQIMFYNRSPYTIFHEQSSLLDNETIVVRSTQHLQLRGIIDLTPARNLSEFQIFILLTEAKKLGALAVHQLRTRVLRDEDGRPLRADFEILGSNDTRLEPLRGHALR